MGFWKKKVFCNFFGRWKGSQVWLYISMCSTRLWRLPSVPGESEISAESLRRRILSWPLSHSMAREPPLWGQSETFYQATYYLPFIWNFTFREGIKCQNCPNFKQKFQYFCEGNRVTNISDDETKNSICYL